ncbi:MAG: hypothetical protein CVV27_03665 [Candidatus Melainabacteria bacterium HGW-Melainabacteria-1]|nr:MAG: hypothetical protein CVV27_03665 [Candidatus Melainabacteria bacterium HGW-Melainabacteria-1]
MHETLRSLPSLCQIQLALMHRTYRIASKTEQDLLVWLPSAQQHSPLRLRYCDLHSTQSQLLEMDLPLGLNPDAQQLEALTPMMTALNNSLCNLSLVLGPAGLSLHTKLLHPRQLPDLKSLLRQIRDFGKARSLCHALLSSNSEQASWQQYLTSHQQSAKTA